MKIDRVVTHHLRVELSEDQVFASSKEWHHVRESLLVEVRTADGVCGFGEGYGPAAPIRTVVDELYAPLLLGRDPLETEVTWEKLYSRFRDYGQKGLPIAALSAVDIALWDLKGKLLGQPVHKLVGGPFRTALQAYATGLYRSRSADPRTALVKEALGYLERGYTAMKLKVGFGLQEDIANVAALREVLGTGAKLMVDANHAYCAADAIRLGRAMEPYNIYWFEEPVIPETIDAYLEVKQAVSIPLAGGEAEFTRFGFRDLISRRAVDILQPDICGCGGFSEVLKISALASSWGITCYPHVWGSAVGLCASLQFAAVLAPNPSALFPPPFFFELDQSANPLRDELALEPPSFSQGFIRVPTAPGLGLDVNRRVLERYAV